MEIIVTWGALGTTYHKSKEKTSLFLIKMVATPNDTEQSTWEASRNEIVFKVYYKNYAG